MPTAMPLIGFEKYRNIQTSLESIRSKSMENLPSQNFPIEARITPEIFYPPPQTLPSPIHGYMANTPNVLVTSHNTPSTENPFYFGNTPSNDYFGSRYNPDNYINTTLSGGGDKTKKAEVCNSKTNLLEVNSEQVSSENEENLKFKTSKEEEKSAKIERKIEVKKPESKAPKLSIRRKVSIHFKGKKDKKNKSLDQLDVKTAATPEKKHSLFDIKFTTTESKQKDNLQKTPSVDSKKNFIENGLDVKVSPAPDSKRNSNEVKTPCPENASGVDTPKIQDKKGASVSPERKHVHVKEDGKKPHKKHKKNDKKNRRSTISAEKFYNDRVLRERSFSVCTERSNMLGMGLGFNSAFSMYDDCPISDRERTNSLSSCGTIKLRKMSNMSNFPITGKIPWCACWGNGCLWLSRMWH